MSLNQDTERLDICLAELRDIVGDAEPRESLVQVILAADYNLGRAVNYFYSRSDE